MRNNQKYPVSEVTNILWSCEKRIPMKKILTWEFTTLIVVLLPTSSSYPLVGAWLNLITMSWESKVKPLKRFCSCVKKNPKLTNKTPQLRTTQWSCTRNNSTRFNLLDIFEEPLLREQFTKRKFIEWWILSPQNSNTSLQQQTTGRVILPIKVTQHCCKLNIVDICCI